MAAALQGKMIDTGMAIAQVKPAPTVEIVKTVESTDKAEAQITLKIKDNGGGIGDIRLFINGTAIKIDIARGLLMKQTGVVFKTYSIKLNPGKNYSAQ